MQKLPRPCKAYSLRARDDGETAGRSGAGPTRMR